jgi:hypothetical protein
VQKTAEGEAMSNRKKKRRARRLRKETRERLEAKQRSVADHGHGYFWRNYLKGDAWIE